MENDPLQPNEGGQPYGQLGSILIPFHYHNGVDSPQLNPKYFSGFPAIKVTDATVAPTDNPPDGIFRFYYDGTNYIEWIRLNNLWKSFTIGSFVLLGSASTGEYSSKEYDNGNVTGTATIDWSKGNVQYATMTGNVTLTFTNPLSGGRYILQLAGAHTPTFPASVRWTGGTTPAATATAGHKDLYTLIYSAKENLYDILQSPNYATT